MANGNKYTLIKSNENDENIFKDKTEISKVIIVDVNDEELNSAIFHLISSEEYSKILYNENIYKNGKLTPHFYNWFIPNKFSNVNFDRSSEEKWQIEFGDFFEDLIEKDKKLDKKNVELDKYHVIAEALLPIFFKEILNWDTIPYVLDLGNYINNTKTGADSCLYNLEDNSIILGESKFYKKFDAGIDSMISSLENYGYKLNDLYRKFSNKDSSDDSQIVMRKISEERIDENIDIWEFDDFKNINKTFAGFLLYEKENDPSKTVLENKAKKMNEEIILSEHNFEKCIVFRLGVKSKHELIKKIIMISKDEYDKSKGK